MSCISNTIDTKGFKKFPTSSCLINCIHVQINDIKAIIKDFETHIADKTWINNLDELDKQVYQATSERTINKIVKEIIAKVSTTLNDDIGEYLVSYSAQLSLETNFKHKKIPLAELLKEKVSGNPGFDFHTISSGRLIVFGEAKFSMSDTPRAASLDQIAEFISLKKDLAEIQSIKSFMDDDVKKSMSTGKKGFAGAFSYNSKNLNLIFKNAFESDIMEELVKHYELYLIAVEIC